MQKLLFILFILSFVNACSSQDIKRSTYDTLYNKQCMDDVGSVNCDPDRLEYDEYMKQRESIINK